MDVAVKLRTIMISAHACPVKERFSAYWKYTITYLMYRYLGVSAHVHGSLTLAISHSGGAQNGRHGGRALIMMIMHMLEPQEPAFYLVNMVVNYIEI
jgi:hypothetical protein